MSEQAKPMDMVERGRESLKASEELTKILPWKQHPTNYAVLKRILSLEAQEFTHPVIKVSPTLVKQVAITIADTWNHKDKTCIITVEAIEALTGCSRSARLRAVKVLKERGFFGVKEGFVSKNGVGVANHYYPLWDIDSRRAFGNALDIWEANAPVLSEPLAISKAEDTPF